MSNAAVRGQYVLVRVEGATDDDVFRAVDQMGLWTPPNVKLYDKRDNTGVFVYARCYFKNPSEIDVKPQTVKYVNASDVFEDNPNALQAFDDSGEHSYGDNDLTLVVRDTMIANMKNLKGDDEDTDDEIDKVIDILKELDASTYINLED